MAYLTHTVPMNQLAPQIRKAIKAVGVAPKEIEIILQSGAVASEQGNWRVQNKVWAGAAGSKDVSYIGSDGEHNPTELVYGKVVLGYGKKCGRGYPSFARINVALGMEIADDAQVDDAMLAVAMDMILAAL